MTEHLRIDELTEDERAPALQFQTSFGPAALAATLFSGPDRKRYSSSGTALKKHFQQPISSQMNR